MKQRVAGLLAAVALVLVFSGAMALPVLAEGVENHFEFYVAPQAQGAGDGSSLENAAYFRQVSFWIKVQRSLNDGPVTVYFAPGEYIFSKNVKDGQIRSTLRLEGYGHPEHHLTLQGLYPEGTIFMSDPDEPVSEDLSIDLFVFDGRNATIRYFHFTGEQHMGYASRFFGEDLIIEHNTFIDLPNVYYGATGTAYERSRNITFRNNTFIRVGLDSHAHMIYNAYGPQHVYVINNYFEDCSGEYIRFRDNMDYVVVFGNTFKSTGTWRGGNRPFVSFPLFNSRDPAVPGQRMEYFGNYALIAHNTFIYPDDNSGGTRQVLHWLHRGFDPPGRGHLLSANDARLLLRGTTEEKKAFLKERLGLDTDYIYFYGNTYIGRGAEPTVKYDSQAQYGARSLGWSSPIDITDTINTTPVVSTAEEAAQFWKNFTAPEA